MYSRVAAVTGGNKGIGLAIVRQLALQYPKSSLNNGRLLIYLTARDKARGEAAVEELLSDAKLRQAKALTQDGGETDIKYAELDIGSKASVRRFTGLLRNEHEGIDIVVNNAGIMMDGFDAEIAEKTVQTNYYGTLETCQTFIPLVRPGGRVVNMSSTLGTIGKYSQALQGRFKAVSSINDVTALMEEFKQSAAKGTLQQHGWTAAAYAASKAGVIAATRILAEAEAKHGRGILINSCCPGYVSTDMTKNRGAKTPDQGAQTPVLLALGGIGGRYGLFWRDKKPANEV